MDGVGAHWLRLIVDKIGKLRDSDFVVVRKEGNATPGFEFYQDYSRKREMEISSNFLFSKILPIRNTKRIGSPDNNNLPTTHLAFIHSPDSLTLHYSTLKTKTMQTLKELIQTIDLEIRKKNIDNALDLVSPFENYDGEDWKIHYLPQKNEFQSSVLYQDDNFKLLLIYWSTSDKSKKHGHMKGGGLIRVLAGKIKETRFHPNNMDLAIGTFEYAKGELSYIHDALAYHIVENQEEQPAVSLHLYCTGTNSTFGVFEEMS